MAEISIRTRCYHCGDECIADPVIFDQKNFCCQGCKLVYEIILENNLCPYYDLNAAPGKRQEVINTKFSYLDDAAVLEKIISFRNKEQVSIDLDIPSIHCSSCIWLLENFHRIEHGIISSKVNFLEKKISLVFNSDLTRLSSIVTKLAKIGYEPSFSSETSGKKLEKKKNRGRIIRITVAGFCFGNIMMLSFPDYFSSGNIGNPDLQRFFSIMILILSLPVFIYSASEFYVRSWQSLRTLSVSIDLPIALGILAIFLRSSFEIISNTGQGYFDSGSGLIFFMLIGRWFQDYTFDSLSFERDYRSFFPITVRVKRHNTESDVLIENLVNGDRMIILNNEVIPIDAILDSDNAHLDYSFITGESSPVHVRKGEKIFSGGKLTGSAVDAIVLNAASHGNLAKLWSRDSKNNISRFEKLTGTISKYFIITTILIALFAGAFWWQTDIRKAVNAITSVLVIACPCALALSAPFTYGNIIRRLGRKKIYLRNYHILEKLADVDTIVFDKTGTLTNSADCIIEYYGKKLTDYESRIISALVNQSQHPLCRSLYKYLPESSYSIESFYEFTGKGIEGIVEGVNIKAGSKSFIGISDNECENFSNVYIAFNGNVVGKFIFRNAFRKGLNDLACSLIDKRVVILSGDNNVEEKRLKDIFGKNTELIFNQTPGDKKRFINKLKNEGKNILMVGDGLNDAGALSASDVGISITDHQNNFTPASDVIIDASKLTSLDKLLRISKSAEIIIITSFIISLFYNAIGLAFAVTGSLSPLTAAILMPISTISLVLFTVFSSSIKTKTLFPH
jgi:Cu+-exporting ATPase